MAGIDTGGHGGGKKSVNQELPLIPFIDFLLCCVMFLLVTAVWNQLARITTDQTMPGRVEHADREPPESRTLVVSATGYELHIGDGPVQTIARNGQTYDHVALADRLALLQRSDPQRHDLVIESQDGVLYEDIVAAMDTTASAGLVQFSLSPIHIGR
jgi:biopolymer transport protein ExbD